jgi:glycerol-3-phosphate dehydrogenase
MRNSAGETFLYTDREKFWQSLSEDENKQWDLIVVGGGITGAGVLREAARIGLKVLLIEQRDFAWGTSSRSSKMVHGGLRYLAQGDLKLTRHSLNERERLLEEAPGLVDRMGYYMMMKRGQFPGRFAMKVILTIYDFIAGVKDNRYCNRQTVRKLFPSIDIEHIKGACYYTDAVTDDSRLVLRVLQEAQIAQESKQQHVQVLNYTKVQKLLLSNGKVRGVVIENTETGCKSELEAGVIVNATGVWADRLRNEINPEQRVRPLRGSHLMISRERLQAGGVATLFHPEDKRPVFIYPWEGATVVGTTDLDHRENLDNEASISTQEVEYLLKAVNNLFPSSEISRTDIIATWSGVRPVIGSDNGLDPSKERRDHAVWSDSGLITVSGGKLTTFRLIARDVIAMALPWLKSVGVNLPSVDDTIDDRVFRPLKIKTEDLMIDDQRRVKRLLGRYGDYAVNILDNASVSELTKIADTEYCLAECRWAIKNEAVIHLDDLMLRRTRLGLLLRNGGEELFDSLQPIFSEELGWDQVHWKQEIVRYLNIWQQYYSLPLSEGGE